MFNSMAFEADHISRGEITGTAAVNKPFWRHETGVHHLSSLIHKYRHVALLFFLLTFPIFPLLLLLLFL